jgi:LytR cell envelope-related transcriptional attenuator
VVPQRGRGVGTAFPSPVVIVSILAVAMAAIAFVATRGGGPVEREVALPARSTPTVVPTPTITSKPAVPEFKRGKVYVEVYNNSGEQGLASQVGDRASSLGWQVVGADNWYGTIPASTVYFPPRLRAAAHQLALDLAIKRLMPAVEPMRGDRLTVILTGPLG